ncbi:MAG TPA: GNAT family protein [Acidobacteriaceae bacterium]|nr:GNAT family protein [Acidobacteriaceae bacterium]
MQAPTLEGAHVRLEPLTLAHLPDLEAIAFDPSIWRYMLSIIRTPADLRAWAESALATPNSLPWVTIRKAHDTTPDQLAGSTRFLDLDLTHRTTELGHTWLAASARGTLINAEAKLLQLTYAFETLNLNRVALKTHHENLQSQNAMKALGALYEGTFRNHYLMPDGTARHSVWFSITREDWPQVKERLTQRLKASV